MSFSSNRFLDSVDAVVPPDPAFKRRRRVETGLGALGRGECFDCGRLGRGLFSGRDFSEKVMGMNKGTVLVPMLFVSLVEAVPGENDIAFCYGGTGRLWTLVLCFGPASVHDTTIKRKHYEFE